MMVPLAVSLHWRYLHQDLGWSSREIIALRKYSSYSKATVCRHMKLPIIDSTPTDGRRANRGRPRVFQERDERRILRVAEQLRSEYGHFTIKRVKLAAGVQHVSDETVRKVFRKAGLRYTHSRKKGVLKRTDLKRRVRFAKSLKKTKSAEQLKKLFRHDICFYFDAVGFTHKYNPFDQAKAPRTMAWRRPNDGLDFERTAKGTHEGSGGRVAHFFCAISYAGGMVLAEQYMGRLNGDRFSAFVKETFPKLVSPGSRKFLMDGCPVQNCKTAKKAISDVKCEVFSIPPRSPDLNPIENTFHTVKEQLREEAIVKRITFENFEQFSERCRRTLVNVSKDLIRRTIDSMPKRLDDIIRRNGQRTKY